MSLIRWSDNRKAFSDKHLIIDFIFLWLIKSLDHVIDELDLVLIDTFMWLNWFAENGPENIE